MVYSSLIQSKLIAKNRGIKDYEKMSENKLLSALNASKSIKMNLSEIKNPLVLLIN